MSEASGLPKKSHCTARDHFRILIRVIHRDIKSDNILCDTKGNIRVADLGISVMLTKEKFYRKTSHKGTMNFMSPETLKG